MLLQTLFARSIISEQLCIGTLVNELFNEEQQGKDCADYGNYLIKYFSEKLQPEFGSDFSVKQLELMRQFYKIFPIANTLYRN